jgi:hypothetical protein
LVLVFFSFLVVSTFMAVGFETVYIYLIFKISFFNSSTSF